VAITRTPRGIKIKKIEKLIYRGMLYDDTRDVSKQHLGITYEVLVDLKSMTLENAVFLWIRSSRRYLKYNLGANSLKIGPPCF